MTVTVEHPALVLLRDSLAASRLSVESNLRAEEITKLLGHALDATGYQLVEKARTSANVVTIARCPEHGLHGQRENCYVCGGPVEQVAFIHAVPPPLGLDELAHNHKDAGDYWRDCPRCALLEGYYRGQVDQAAPGSGAAAIAWERERQVVEEGFDGEHDRTEHLRGDLLGAGIAYAIYAWWQIAEDASGNASGWTEEQVLDIVLEQWWPFDERWWKPALGRGRNGGARKNMAKAGALIAAEMDRLLKLRDRGEIPQ